MENTAIEIDLETYKTLEANRRNFEQSLGEILKEMLFGVAKVNNPPTKNEEPRIMHPREYTKVKPTEYAYTINGVSYKESKLKDAYRSILLRLNNDHPKFLDAFSKEGNKARAIVARSREDIYLKSPHLINCAELLIDGWWYDTNLSEDQVAKRVEKACKLLNLDYQSDIILHFC
jgi:hypothetical protein